MTDSERKDYEKKLRERLTEERFRHCQNVAAEAVRLAQIHGGDVEKAELAGLLHDIMKQEKSDVQLKYVRKINKRPSVILLSIPKLWHAPAGAAYLEHELKIRDKDVINAVRYHTTGREGMSLLEKIIYIADYTSAERKYNGVDKMRELAERDLTAAMQMALSYTIQRHADGGKLIHPDTFKAYNEVVILGGNQ